MKKMLTLFVALFMIVNIAKSSSPNVGDSTSNCNSYFWNANLSSTIYNFYASSWGGDSTSFISWHWDFGDGSTSNEQNPIHKYKEAGTFNVCLFANRLDSLKNNICSSSYCSSVVINSCYSKFSVDSLSTPTFKFIDQSTTILGTISSWFWDFGDGTTSSEQNPTHTFLPTKLYNVKLNISTKDSLGNVYCSDSTYNYVFASNQFCHASYNYSNYSNVFSFYDNSSFATSWHWDFGDGTTSNIQNPTHTFAVMGFYNVSLTISKSDSLGGTCMDTYYGNINAPDTITKCVVSEFNWSLGIDKTVNFYDMSKSLTGTITNWNWNFGDGTVSTEQNPIHKYTTPGNYQVSLSVTKNDSLGSGCSDSFVSFIGVNDSTQTTCNSSFTFMNIGQPLKYQFADNSNPGNGNIVSWNWNFGDGTTSNDQNPTHQFPRNGYYYVSLTINSTNSNGGCQSSNGMYVHGFDSIANPSCQANFIFTKSDSNTFSFTDLSNLPLGSNRSWNWSFGDGQSSNEQNPTHKYLYNGVFTVCLTIAKVDSLGDTCSNTYCLNVNSNSVIPQNDTTGNQSCQAHFTYQINGNMLYQFVNSSNIGNRTLTNIYWYFGDHSSSTDQNPIHTYSASGNYIVHLYIESKDSLGICYSNDSIYIHVYDSIHPDTTNINPCSANLSQYRTTGNTYQFLDTSNPGSGVITAWSWDFGDGTTATIPNPIHTYTSFGFFNIKLAIKTTSNYGGCNSQINTYLTVADSAKILIPSDTTSNKVDTCIITGKVDSAWVSKIYADIKGAHIQWSILQNGKISKIDVLSTISTAGVYFMILDISCDGKRSITHLQDVINVTTQELSSTGIDNLGSKKINIFPNPATDYIELTGCNKQLYIISDIQGRKVVEGRIDNDSRIDISFIANGSYIINLPELNNYARFIK